LASSASFSFKKAFQPVVLTTLQTIFPPKSSTDNVVKIGEMHEGAMAPEQNPIFSLSRKVAYRKSRCIIESRPAGTPPATLPIAAWARGPIEVALSVRERRFGR